MIGRKKSENRKKTKMVGVRATPEEMDMLNARAAAFGISVAELCRQSVFGKTPQSKTDQVAVAELAVTRKEMGREGGLLKGWLSGAFPNAPALTPDDRIQLRSILKKIDAGQDKMVELAKKIIETP